LLRGRDDDCIDVITLEDRTVVGDHVRNVKALCNGRCLLMSPARDDAHICASRSSQPVQVVGADIAGPDHTYPQSSW
jgi:hypothetical protein